MTCMAVVVAIILVAASSRASAQAFFNNPPCAFVTVSNLNPFCNAQINLITVPAFVWPGFFLAPGAAVNLPVPIGGVQVLGLITPAGVPVRLNPPPAPFAGCGPTGWWAAGVPLDPLNPGCLFNVCADPATCSITVF